jgi:hypothetical protein
VANLANLTYFAASDFHSITKEGADVLAICVAGRFDLPSRDHPRRDPLRISDDQPPPPAADIYWGEPGESSLRYENQATYVRPGTDVYLNGHARPPGGRPVTELRVKLQVGALSKETVAIGDRVWQGGLLGLSASPPRPFDAMPLVYERAFGGNLVAEGIRPAAWEQRNLVGRGLYRDAMEAAGKPLPNLEDPARRISRWSDRPPPAGFGPIARSWLPRLPFGGAYDARWVEERCPLWPLDMDLRFFQAASPGLVAAPYLVGGERVRIEGVSSHGPIEFMIPRRRLIVKSTFRHKVDIRPMVLDGLLIEPDQGAVTLYWRAAVPIQRELHLHQHSVVRQLEDWEAIPA